MKSFTLQTLQIFNFQNEIGASLIIVLLMDLVLTQWLMIFYEDRHQIIQVSGQQALGQFVVSQRS